MLTNFSRFFLDWYLSTPNTDSLIARGKACVRFMSTIFVRHTAHWQLVFDELNSALRVWKPPLTPPLLPYIYHEFITRAIVQFISTRQWIFRSARASWNTSVRPSVRPLVRKKKLEHLYTGIDASWIIWRFIKPTWWPQDDTLDPLGLPGLPSTPKDSYTGLLASLNS